jgi:uncharacterized protein
VKIVIPGGSGHVGTILARDFHGAGHEVVVLSRQPQPRPWRVVSWDGATPGSWSSELDGCDVVINLAGRSVNCRYTPANRRAILESRLLSTRVVGQAIAQAALPPRLWLQASTATIYSHRFDAPNDESSSVPTGHEPNSATAWEFSGEVTRAWERVFDEAMTTHTRKIALRTSLVMSPEPGGVFDILLGLVRYGLGGTAGNGRQFVSWIHCEDFLRAIRWLIQHGDVEGVVNLAAPHPLPNAEFMRALRQAWGMPVGLPAATWMLEIGALFLRTETELILKSRRVVPRRLLDQGFQFRFPSWPNAARDLCRQWRSVRQADGKAA